MRTFLTLLVSAAILVPAAARAEVTVQLKSDAAQQQYAQLAGVSLADIQMQLQTELDRLFQEYEPEKYLQRFSDAQAFTTRGLGVDYASNIRYLMVGFATNFSVNAEEAYVPKDTKTRPPVEGAATNLTAMVGLNLGLIGLRPVTLYGNYWRSEGTYREFDALIENRGFHVQLKLFGPAADESMWSAVLRWGGIDITTGFDYARTRMNLVKARTLARAIPIGDARSGGPVVNVASTGTFGLDMSTTSIPLEVTTNVRLLHLLTLYGGVGFDWQLGGGGDMVINLDGTMTGTVPGQTANVDLGTATVVAEEDSEPSKARVRGLIGVQANVWLVKVFTQVNFVPDPFAASVGVGVRLAW